MVKRDLIRNIILGILLLCALIGLRVFVFEPYTIQKAESNSYLKEGDLTLANRLDKIKRQDFVLYEVDGKEYVGRVIAMEKDKVIYMDDVLYLNDKIVEETYLTKDKDKYLTKADYFTHDFTIPTLTQSEEERIPVDFYLILNDQRQNMDDSRTFGLIAKNQIKGVLTFKVLPLDQFGLIKTR